MAKLGRIRPDAKTLNPATMNLETPMRYLLAAALIVDAIAGHLLYRSAFFEPSGDQPSS